MQNEVIEMELLETYRGVRIYGWFNDYGKRETVFKLVGETVESGDLPEAKRAIDRVFDHDEPMIPDDIKPKLDALGIEFEFKGPATRKTVLAALKEYIELLEGMSSDAKAA